MPTEQDTGLRLEIGKLKRDLDLTA